MPHDAAYGVETPLTSDVEAFMVVVVVPVLAVEELVDDELIDEFLSDDDEDGVKAVAVGDMGDVDEPEHLDVVMMGFSFSLLALAFSIINHLALVGETRS